MSGAEPLALHLIAQFDLLCTPNLIAYPHHLIDMDYSFDLRLIWTKEHSARQYLLISQTTTSLANGLPDQGAQLYDALSQKTHVRPIL